MSKPIIAIDIDDVLADNAGGFIEWSNARFGTHLTADDYQEHWAEMWKVDKAETERRALDFHTSDHISTYKVISGAREVLEELKNNYKLILITSRRLVFTKLTKEWIDKYYPNLFEDCIYCGFFDSRGVSGLQLTKAVLAKDAKADYLIDDQIKHVEAAAEIGIKGLLFGEYTWNRKESLPVGVTRVRNWKEILEYFDLS